jgi:hypothetical protein
VVLDVLDHRSTGSSHSFASGPRFPHL